MASACLSGGLHHRSGGGQQLHDLRSGGAAPILNEFTLACHKLLFCVESCDFGKRNGDCALMKKHKTVFGYYKERILTERSPVWTSLRVQAFESDGVMEAFETQASLNQLVVIGTKGRGKVESFANGLWKGAAYYPGTGGMTPSGETSRMRWQPHGLEPLQTLHLSIAPHVFVGAKDEYRRAGTSFREQSLNALSFFDPVISRIALSVADAATVGAPDLYAQSAAQFLAVHLLSRQNGWSDAFQDNRSPGTLVKRRLTPVLEYIHFHYREPLSLNRLAEEAGVSPFHFVRLFKDAVGVTPHRYLIKIRLEAAASLLTDTDMSSSCPRTGRRSHCRKSAAGWRLCR